MKNTRGLRRLINDPRICVLLPAEGGYAAISMLGAISANRFNIPDPLGRGVLEDILTGMDRGFVADVSLHALPEEFRIARIDVSHDSAMRLYDRVCAMERAGVSGVVLERACHSSLARQGDPDMSRLVETLAGARWDPDFVIAARISASEEGGCSALIRSLADCAHAGADLLFVNGSIPSLEVRKLAEEIPKGLCLDFSRVGQQPREWRASLQELQSMAINAVVLPSVRQVCENAPRSAATMERAVGFASCARNRRRRIVTQRACRIRSIAEVKS